MLNKLVAIVALLAILAQALPAFPHRGSGRTAPPIEASGDRLLNP